MQKFVCAIGLFALVFLFQELLVCVEGSRVRVVKVKKTRHDKRQALTTGYGYQSDDADFTSPSNYEDISYIGGNRRSDRIRTPILENFETDVIPSPIGNSNKVKRAGPDDEGHINANEADGCLGCGNGIPGEPGKDYPLFSSPPDTKFDCKAQKFPGYYADPEARCQVFWICQDKRADAFLCPNGTIFNQQVLVCDWWFNVDCATAGEFYTRNQYIYAGPGVAINGEKIAVYKSSGNTNGNANRAPQGLDAGPTGGANRRRAARRDTFESDNTEFNYEVRDEKPREQQYERNYNQREQNSEIQRYSKPQIVESNRKPTTLNEERGGYTTQPSVGFTGPSSVGGGSTGSYLQIDSESYRKSDVHNSRTSPAASTYSNSKQSKNPHPFLSQGTYPAQTTQRQTTSSSVNPRREQYTGQRVIQNPNALQYNNNNKQHVSDVYPGKKTIHPGKSQPQEYQQRQASQRYNNAYDSATQRYPTTTKRNAIDADFSKEYTDIEDAFPFHFAKIPTEIVNEPKEISEAVVPEKFDLGVSITTYRPSLATTAPKIFTSSDSSASRQIAQHPKYDEEDSYTTAVPVFGKKVKSGKKRNTADWTNYFRSKN